MQKNTFFPSSNKKRVNKVFEVTAAESPGCFIIKNEGLKEDKTRESIKGMDLSYFKIEIDSSAFKYVCC